MMHQTGLAIRRHATAQVFVDILGDPELSPDDTHHLSRVRRVRDGEHIVVCDGAGAWQMWVWNSGTLDEAIGDIVVEPELTYTCVGVPLLAPGRTELAVEKLTELGVARITPFVSERVQRPPKPDRAAVLLERLHRIAREAAAQCRSVQLPVIDDVQQLGELVGSRGDTLAFADPDGGPLTDAVNTLIVGPEGGFTDAEIGLAPTVWLSRHVLRAETAAIAAGVLLTAGLRGANEPNS